MKSTLTINLDIETKEWLRKKPNYSNYINEIIKKEMKK